MGRRLDPGSKAETRLARLRLQRGVTQDELAAAIGISEPTYRRLERGAIKNPSLRYLTNAALALGVELDDVLEDEWREWFVFDERSPTPPDPERFSRQSFQPEPR